MKNCPELFSYLTLLHKVRYFSGTAVKSLPSKKMLACRQHYNYSKDVFLHFIETKGTC